MQQRPIKLTRGEIIVTCGGIDEGSSFDRPLRVHSRHGVYEGVGARFILRQENDGTRPSVTAGWVVIHSPLAADGIPTQVQAGQSYLIDHHQASLAPPLDMDVGAWADDLRLSGVFRLENTDTLLAILPQTLPVQLRYRTRWWVTLERQA